MKLRIVIYILLKFVFKDPIHNKSTLVKVVTSLRTDDKPLPASILIAFS